MAVRVAQRFVFLPLFAFGGCSDSNPPPNKHAENVVGFFSLPLSLALVKSAQEKPLFDQILEFFNLRNEEEKKGSFGETTPTTQQKSFALLRNNTERERERLLSDLTFTDSFIKRLHSSGPCLLYTSPSPRDRSLSRMPSSA